MVEEGTNKQTKETPASLYSVPQVLQGETSLG